MFRFSRDETRRSSLSPPRCKSNVVEAGAVSSPQQPRPRQRFSYTPPRHQMVEEGSQSNSELPLRRGISLPSPHTTEQPVVVERSINVTTTDQSNEVPELSETPQRSQSQPLAEETNTKKKKKSKTIDSKTIDEEESCTSEMQWIHVAPGLSLPVLGSGETIRALTKNRIARHSCWSCEADLGCVKTAHFVLCPHCRCIMPTGQETGQACVGLGFSYNGGEFGEVVERSGAECPAA